MSRTLIARLATSAGAAVVLLLAGCGGEDSGADTSSGASAATSGDEETGASGGGDFCEQAAGIEERVESAMSDLDDESPSVPDAFTQVAEELRAIEAPDAIASDWDAMAAGLDRMAEAFADFDITDPDSLAAVDEAEGDLTTASTNVEDYLRDECGIEP
ncbi:hypothetical protein E4P40_18315 [Blastococcus sp. CT_GayMR20]|uniref:hypothetical protein n=1 Tax=Blastococcus sp. CT_GayMR20 TaxID=2559609 RepID=UPI001073841B|nr:hypothetical protein [Blastococcus sp. CT_GayMR20]TFV79595.1 hypothetical protein E4P40_18315 [Blastococcus sp. CT_GayMR20]